MIWLGIQLELTVNKQQGLVLHEQQEELLMLSTLMREKKNQLELGASC